MDTSFKLLLLHLEQISKTVTAFFWLVTKFCNDERSIKHAQRTSTMSDCSKASFTCWEHKPRDMCSAASSKYFLIFPVIFSLPTHQKCKSSHHKTTLTNNCPKETNTNKDYSQNHNKSKATNISTWDLANMLHTKYFNQICVKTKHENKTSKTCRKPNKSKNVWHMLTESKRVWLIWSLH